MATNRELKDRLKQIDAWLATGATTVVADGVTTSVDLDSLRNERRRILNQLPEYRKLSKPSAYRVHFGG